MNCNNCGKAVQANWNICPECGAKLQNTVAVATQSEKNKNKPVYKKWWFWVLLIIGLGIIGSIEEELEKENINEYYYIYYMLDVFIVSSLLGNSRGHLGEPVDFK